MKKFVLTGMKIVMPESHYEKLPEFQCVYKHKMNMMNNNKLQENKLSIHNRTLTHQC